MLVLIYSAELLEDFRSIKFKAYVPPFYVPVTMTAISGLPIEETSSTVI